MFFLNLRRVAGQGLVMFWRNGIVSFTAVFVSAIALFIVGAVIIGNAFLAASLTEIKDKVDVNVYFLTTASEADILNLKKRLDSLPEIKSVEYVNREEALRRFVARNSGNSLLLQSLEELGENPLGATFNIKANEPGQYASIADFLDKGTKVTMDQSEPSIIDRVNYSDNKIVIERLKALLAGADKLGFAIYNFRQEISVMRLVGAGNNFIRGPFIISGTLYGLMGAILAGILLYPASFWVTVATATFFGGIDLTIYYVSNLGQIFMVLLLSGILLGMVSSYLAVRRYLSI